MIWGGGIIDIGKPIGGKIKYFYLCGESQCKSLRRKNVVKEKKMKKKLLSVMLALCLTAGTFINACFPTKVYAQEQVQTEGGYQYKVLDDGSAMITRYVGEDTKPSIPSEIGGKQVTGIGQSAFTNCERIEEVTIPEGVTSIGTNAFRSTSLKEITIPASVARIEEAVFTGSKSLENIYVDEKMSRILRLMVYYIPKIRRRFGCVQRGSRVVLIFQLA